MSERAAPRLGRLLVLAILLASAMPVIAAPESPRPEMDARRTKAGFQGDPPNDLSEWAAAFGWDLEITHDGLDLAVFTAGIESVAADHFLERLRGRGDVAWASYDGIARASHPRAPLFPNPPTDPFWWLGTPPQYGPQLIGLGGVGLADDAWDYEAGRRDTFDVLVAVLDSGVHAAHEELLGPSTPFCTAPNNYDVYGHGTLVAGVVAAESNNGAGIAGVAQVKIACFKALSDVGVGWYSQIAIAILEASALQTPATRVVAILSLGGPCFAFNLYLCNDMQRAVEIASERGVLLVAASGNDHCIGAQCIAYPAAYPQVLAVGSIGPSSTRSSFSNGGQELDLVAPGEDVISTASPTTVVCNAPAGYCALSGTSMSAPHVAGAAALVWSHCPHLTRTEVAAALNASAVDLGDIGWDPLYGHGRVNPSGAIHHLC